MNAGRETESARTPEQKPAGRVMSHRAKVIEHMGWSKSGETHKPDAAAIGVSLLAQIIIEKEIARRRAAGEIA